MKKLFNLIILLLISITFSGCNIIEDDREFIVIAKHMSNYTNYKFVYDLKNSAHIFETEFYSNRNFEIGDTLKLQVN